MCKMITKIEMLSEFNYTENMEYYIASTSHDQTTMKEPRRPHLIC